VQKTSDYCSTLEEQWINHLRPESVPFIFPRNVGFPWRKNVFNVEQYLAYVTEHDGNSDVFVSVFSDFQRRNNMFDTIYIDVDLENTSSEKEFKKVQYLFLRLVSERIYPRLEFSGSKGFHFWIDFGMIKINDFANATKKLFEELKLTELIRKKDRGVFCDKNRLSRVIYTMHPETGLLCYPVVENILETKLLTIRRNALREFTSLPSVNNVLNENVGKLLWEYDKNTVVRTVDMNIKDRSFNKDDIPIYPSCISDAIKNMYQSCELDHYKRLHLAAFFNYLDFPIEEMNKIFMLANDYNSNLTLYHLRRIKNLHLCPYSCDKAAFLGLCPLSDKRRSECTFYPSIVWSLWQFMKVNGRKSLLLQAPADVNNIGGKEKDVV